MPKQISIKTTKPIFFNSSNMERATDLKLKKFCNKVNQVARAKYVPVASGKTMTSCKSTKISKNEYALSSINWGSKSNNANSGRYNRKKPNDSYYIYLGVGQRRFIPQSKNAGKYQWFNRASKEVANGFDWELR